MGNILRPPHGTTAAAAIAVVIANKNENEFLKEQRNHSLEEDGSYGTISDIESSPVALSKLAITVS